MAKEFKWLFTVIFFFCFSSFIFGAGTSEQIPICPVLGADGTVTDPNCLENGSTPTIDLSVLTYACYNEEGNVTITASTTPENASVQWEGATVDPSDDHKATIPLSSAGIHNVTACINVNGQPASDTATVRIIKVELVRAEEESVPNPDIWPKICTNAQLGYRSAKYKLNIIPESESVEMTVEGQGTPSPTFATNNTEITVTGTEDGSYKLRAQHFFEGICAETPSEPVFSINLVSTLKSGTNSAGVTADTGGFNTSGGADIKKDDGALIEYEVKLSSTDDEYSGKCKAFFTAIYDQTGLELDPDIEWNMTIERSITSFFGEALASFSVSYGPVSFSVPSSPDGASASVKSTVEIKQVGEGASETAPSTTYSLSNFGFLALTRNASGGAGTGSPGLEVSKSTSRIMTVGSDENFRVIGGRAAGAGASNKAKNHTGYANVGAAQVRFTDLSFHLQAEEE